MELARKLALLWLVTAGASFLSIAAWQAWTLPVRIGSYVDSSLEPARTEFQNLAASVRRTTDSLNESVLDNHKAVMASTRTTAAVLRHADEFIQDTNANLNGGLDSRGLTREGILNAASAAVGDMRSDVHALTASGTVALEDLDNSLKEMTTLISTLESEIEKGGPQVSETVASLNSVIRRADTLLQEPSVVSTMKNVEKTTFHAGETAESVDLALRSLRSKLHWVKTILKTVISRLTFSLF